MADTNLSEIRVDPLLINEEDEIQETGETLGNNSMQEKELSLWLSSIMEEVKEAKNNQPLGSKIPMVPNKLKNDQNKECYNPLVVSIGPYHYQDRSNKLSEVENLKVPMARQFVLDSGKDIEFLYREVDKVTQNAKQFYNQSSIEDFNDQQFSQMMFLDGCFTLQFINCVTSNYGNLEMSDQQIAHVKRDLFLLENQLPFPVLESLMRLRYEKDENNRGMKLMYDFLFFQIQPRDQPLWARIFLPLGWLLLLFIVAIISIYPSSPILGILSTAGLLGFLAILASLLRLLSRKKKKTSEYDWQPDQVPAHLLELLYCIFINSPKAKNKPSSRSCSDCMSYFAKCFSMFFLAKSTSHVASKSQGHYLYYSVKNLKKVGIHFKTSGTCALTDVKFKSLIFYGLLKLPSITIDVSTRSLLLNLVAYETSAVLDQLWVTSYIRLMDSLIDDAEDVKELRSKGILINYLGLDQEVADLFNDMGSSLELDSSAYNDVNGEINSECDSIMKIWVAQWQQTYFSSPWAFIAFTAAAVGLALTATQTYYTIHPPNKE